MPRRSGWYRARTGPHPTEKEKPDDAALFALLAAWAPDAAARRRVLAENPAALYGFEKSA